MHEEITLSREVEAIQIPSGDLISLPSGTKVMITQALGLIAGTRPEPAVFLEGDPAYYRRLGFEAAGTYGFRRPSLRIPEPAFQVFRLPSFDATLSGTLVYPDAFWRTDSVGLR